MFYGGLQRVDDSRQIEPTVGVDDGFMEPVECFQLLRANHYSPSAERFRYRIAKLSQVACHVCMMHYPGSVDHSTSHYVKDTLAWNRYSIGESVRGTS